MTYSLEFIVNTGQFEHAQLNITAETEADLVSHLRELQDETVQAIGQFAVAFKSQVKAGQADALGPRELIEPAPTPAQELIETELGGKIIEVVEHREKPAWAVDVTPEVKPWAEVKAEVKAITATDKDDDW